jgi:hypothetical protein
MKFKFAKSLLLGSIFALGSLGLTACGGDSSSNAGEESSSSGAEELILSSVSEESPLAAASNIDANALPDGNGGYYLSLKGNIATNSDEFETEGYDGDDRVYYKIDSLKFDVGDKNGNRVALPVRLKPGASLGKESIFLASVIDDIPLDQDAVCGDAFTLYVTIYMSGDEPDTEKFAYTARLQTNFTVPCKVIESSSSGPEVCTELEPVEITMSNTTGNDVPALNFSTGTAENPDVTLSIVDRVPYFQASAGVKITMEGSQETGVIPQAPICLEKFTKAYNGEANPMELEDMAWYLVETPAGTYPFMRGSFMAQEDTKGTLTITYLKKK